MAVSGLEQRKVPLVFSASVWSPWGPGMLSPDDEDLDLPPYSDPGKVSSWLGDEDLKGAFDATQKQKRRQRRSHSWGGFASYVQSTFYAPGLTLAADKENLALERSSPKNAANAVKGSGKAKYKGNGKAGSGTSSPGQFMDGASTNISDSDKCPSDNDVSLHDLSSSSNTIEMPCQKRANCRTSPPPGVFKKPVADKKTAAPEDDNATTLAIRNLPHRLTSEDLLKAMDEFGFAGTYDFVYLPHKFKEHRNTGVAFVNFLDADVARRFRASWHKNWPFDVKQAKKTLNVSTATVQGREGNERNAHSHKMDRVKNASYRPLVRGSSDRLEDQPRPCVTVA